MEQNKRTITRRFIIREKEEWQVHPLKPNLPIYKTRCYFQTENYNIQTNTSTLKHTLHTQLHTGLLNTQLYTHTLSHFPSKHFNTKTYLTHSITHLPTYLLHSYKHSNIFKNVKHRYWRDFHAVCIKNTDLASTHPMDRLEKTHPRIPVNAWLRKPAETEQDKLPATKTKTTPTAVLPYQSGIPYV